MSRVLTRVEIPVPASDAEALWYDLTRWAAWVDGFGHVDRVTGDWPRTDSELTWSSIPAGRGRVIESVTRYEARVGQSVDVEDDRIRGTQRVGFKPGSGSVEVTFEMDYVLKGERPFKMIFDAVFVRRPMREAMTRQMLRFRRECITDAELARDA